MDPITQQTLAVAGTGSPDPGEYVDDLFSQRTYTGTGSNDQHLWTGLDNTDGKNLIWIKSREGTYDNIITDTERANRATLITNSDSNEIAANINSFYNSGVRLSNTFGVNRSAFKYIAWNFKAEPGFFDIVTYTGDGTSGRAIAHNLGSTPGMIIIKRRDNNQDWFVSHRELTNFGQHVFLNKSDTASSNVGWISNVSSTQFLVQRIADLNASGATYVAYVFAHDAQVFGDNGNESIIKCGSFTTDSNGQATVDLGWEPQWVMTKRINASGNWGINDSIRSMPANKDSQAPPYSQGSFADLQNAQGNWDAVSPTSTGFNGFGVFGANQKVIYMAIRRPHKPVTTGYNAFYPFTRSGTGAATDVITSFTPDLLITKNYLQNSYQIVVRDRHRGPNQILQTHETNGNEVSNHGVTYFDSHSVTFGADNSGSYSSTSNQSGITYINWAFKRAPGFFDMVSYTGDGTYDGSYSVNHNLTVAPEMIIAKNVSTSGTGWNAYHTGLTSDTYLIQLHSNGNAETNSGQSWAPTSTTFNPQYAGNNLYSSNASGAKFIAYLFATQPGVSKVGTYTGTGNAINIDCGFTNGASFVLIRRVDAGGSTFVLDSARGITTGNDNTLQLNSSDAQIQNQDYLDPLNAGFTVDAAGGAAVNAVGGTYIYLAIA